MQFRHHGGEGREAGCMRHRCQRPAGTLAARAEAAPFQHHTSSNHHPSLVRWAIGKVEDQSIETLDLDWFMPSDLYFHWHGCGLLRGVAGVSPSWVTPTRWEECLHLYVSCNLQSVPHM
jgi:hypothetical protein